MSSTRRILVFTRYPQPGTTKTRLIPEIGAEGAALLQKKLTEQVMGEVQLLEKNENISTTVFYWGGSHQNIVDWLDPGECVAQVGRDLGEKMHHAFLHSFSTGTTAAILIGSDIPDINVALLHRAFTLLAENDLVIGPSLDGGYYLIGIKSGTAPQLLPLLFKDMSWSTSEVYRSTLSRLKEHKCSIATLPVLQDIDAPAQLHLAREKGLL